jgi:diketogulonate reductase-like aldo/keto reductase
LSLRNNPTLSANTLPRLGQGCWNIGDDPTKAHDEKAALRRGLELGMTLLDTAEMYGAGRSEALVGEALRGLPRGSYQLCSKVYPHNAKDPLLTASCEASLKRLNADALDLYLLHWRGDVPLAETVAGLEGLVKAGKIRRWGVSNFDVSDMEELWAVPNGPHCAADQVLYHLGSRGVEFDLLPWLRAHGVAAMAYCPLAQGGTLRRTRQDFLTDPPLRAVAKAHDASVLQLMLAFVLRQPGVTAIPKAGRPAHTEQNARALSLGISPQEWAQIDAVFWPPTAKMHLDIE